MYKKKTVADFVATGKNEGEGNLLFVNYSLEYVTELIQEFTLYLYQKSSLKILDRIRGC